MSRSVLSAELSAQAPDASLRKHIAAEVDRRTRELFASRDERSALLRKDNEAELREPGLSVALDNYFDEIDQRNRVCRTITFWSMLVFGVVTTVVIILIQVFVNYGYQEYSPAVGFVTARVNGVVKARSATMAAADAVVLDGRDVVVPPKEKNALFITTSYYEIRNQEHGACVGMDTCSCVDASAACSDCPKDGRSPTGSGTFTGHCIKTSATGVVPEDRRCEVTAWCPNMGAKRLQAQAVTGGVDPSMRLSHVEEMRVDLTVNTRFSTFEGTSPVQFKLSTTVEKMLQTAGGTTIEDVRRDGAMIFVQFTYACDLDHSNVCEPTITARRLDDFSENDSAGSGTDGSGIAGFGFKTVDYFDEGDKRRLRHLQGIRFAFDVAGGARRYNGAVLLQSIVSGFGFAALAFVVVNEVRLLCEVTRRGTAKRDAQGKMV